MTFYVRTQNKTKLIKLETVMHEENTQTVRQVFDNNVISESTTVTHKILGNYDTIGEYASKERCIEIIDDIQRQIANCNGGVLIYNMPEA